MVLHVEQVGEVALHTDLEHDLDGVVTEVREVVVVVYAVTQRAIDAQVQRVAGHRSAGGIEHRVRELEARRVRCRPLRGEQGRFHARDADPVARRQSGVGHDIALAPVA